MLVFHTSITHAVLFATNKSSKLSRGHFNLPDAHNAYFCSSANDIRACDRCSHTALLYTRSTVCTDVHIHGRLYIQKCFFFLSFYVFTPFPNAVEILQRCLLGLSTTHRKPCAAAVIEASKEYGNSVSPVASGDQGRRSSGDKPGVLAEALKKTQGE